MALNNLLWLKKKKKNKPTSFLYALLKKKISDKRYLNTFNMVDSRMINATRPKFGERLLDSFTIRTLSSAVHLMDFFSAA